jgi:pyridoxal 5'-phosphate synthase pdxS subunit
MAKAIVRATTHYAEAEIVAEVSRGLGEAMRGLETAGMPEGELMQTRGW